VPDTGLRDLISSCFAESPQSRPTLGDILGALSGNGTQPVRPPGGYEPTEVPETRTQTLQVRQGDKAQESETGDIPVSRRTLLLAGIGVAAVGAAIAGGVALASGSGPRKTGVTSPQTAGKITAGPLTVLGPSGARVYSVAFAPRGSLLASGNIDGTVTVWDTASPAQVATLKHANTYTYNPSFSLDGTHSWSVYSVSLSPDGSTLAAGNGDGTVGLWDTADFRLTGTLPGPSGAVWNAFESSVALSPDGTTLASSYNSPQVTLWDLAGRTAIATLPADRRRGGGWGRWPSVRTERCWPARPAMPAEATPVPTESSSSGT
jgi:hypothetical protein